jgi:hypothetical protein
MPKFNNREEYEKWKQEKLESNLERNQVASGEHEKKEPRFEGAAPGRPWAGTEELRSVSDLFSESWEAFKKRFRTLASLYLLSLFFLLGFVGIFAGAGFLFSLLIHELRIALVSVGAVLGLLPGFAAMFWALTAFAYAVTDETLGIGDALKKGWHRAGAFFWLASLAGYIITGGFLLLIVPGIIFMVWFSFAQFVLVTEDERGMAALLKSKEYVKDRWFDVFLRLVVIWIVSGCVGMVPLIGPIVSLVFFPFVMIFIYLIYRDLKEIKGTGMDYPHSAGEKAKWLGAGSLGYVMIPLLLLGILGTTLTIPLIMMLKSMLTR